MRPEEYADSLGSVHQTARVVPARNAVRDAVVDALQTHIPWMRTVLIVSARECQQIAPAALARRIS
jgi:hypothetical protein